MDDRVIDFNELKNKVKDKDVDKFEDYIYSLYYKMAEGKLNMSDFSKNIMEYMDKNNISQDKLINIQKKFLERYGVDPSMIDTQLKMSGLDLNKVNADYESMRKTMSFQEKYKDRLKVRTMSEYFIKNEKNDLVIYLQDENVIVISKKNIDLQDVELNEFLCSYKKLQENKTLVIKLCENEGEYNY